MTTMPPRRFVWLPVLDTPVPRSLCKDGPRPCKLSACRYHLPHATQSEMWDETKPVPESCALDVAATGPKDLTEIANLLGVSKQYALAEEQRAMAKLKKNPKTRELWRLLVGN